MPKKKYLEIEEELRDLDVESMFDRSIVEIQADLTGFQEDYPNHSKLRIYVDHYYESVEIKLMGTRLETDKERDKRLAKAREMKAKKIAAKEEAMAAEKQQLKQLLEKYGDELIG